MVDAIVLAPCKEIIRRAQVLTSAENDASLRLNKQQCKLLVKWLSETQIKLDKFHDALHEEAIRERMSSFPDLGPAIEEFHRVLEGSETLIKSCCCNDQWLMAAIRQDDMKETFAKFLYDLQWCTSVLYSILLTLMRDDNSVNILGPAECKGNLGAFDYFDLSTAAKQDQEDLKVSLYDLKADHICGATCDQHLTEQCLAAKLVAKLDAEALQDDDSSDLSTSPLVLWVNEQHLPDGKRLGQGGFGEVRETRWFEETYAKKTCYVHLKQSFNQELGALARLNHPHIVNLVCCCRDKRTFSLIMERMDKSLFEHLENHREENVTGAVPFSHLRAVDLMLQVAEGMKYIHSRKLVHRDLKSPNILINFSRDSYIAKVADFGLTKIKNASTANQTLNVGTTKWMAPEVFDLAEDEVRPARFHPMKMDVYSFAIVCWEVLTGKVLFADEEPNYNDTDNQMQRLVKLGVRPQLPPDWPTSLADLIQRCWDGNPSLRPDFPEICTQLRYIKGRLLRGESKMELSEQRPFQLEGAKIRQQVSSQGWTIAPKYGHFKWTNWWTLPRAGQGIISFAAHANNDVYIAITNSTEPRISIYEIVIGEWGNSTSVIRHGQGPQQQDICVVATGLMYPGAVNYLWLSIDAEKEMIQVGQGKPYQDVICIYKGGHLQNPMTDAQCIFFTSGLTPITYSDIVVTDIDRIHVWDTFNFSKKSGHLVSNHKWMIFPLHGHYNWAHSWMLPTAGRGIVSFTSEGNNDVHIAISPRPETMNPMYEIVIRGWSRTLSVIRRKNQGLPLCATECNMLHLGTQFWVSIDDQTRIIQVGEGEPCHNVFCVYKDAIFILEAQHVSFTTWNVPVTYSNVAVTTI